MEGWIKLHRKIQSSQLYKSLNSKQRDVMIQCLLSANHDENEWEFGKEICKCESGQFITSLESLRQKCACDVKIQSVRSALLKLEKWQFITNQSTKTGRLITICKWEDYQILKSDTNKEDNKAPTKSQQSSNKEPTTNKNEKNEKNEKKLKARANSFGETLNEFITDHNKEEIIKFWKYWTEPNKSKTKLKFELERTWDTKRRLETWFKNYEKFSK